MAEKEFKPTYGRFSETRGIIDKNPLCTDCMKAGYYTKAFYRVRDEALCIKHYDLRRKAMGAR